MKKSEIKSRIKKDYGEWLLEQGGDHFVTLDTLVQIVDDFLEDRRANSTEYWKPCVATYFVWYKSKFGFDPDIKGQNSKFFKEIMGKLKQTAEENKLEWCEDLAKKYVLKLMNAAYKDDWLKKHFLLRHINEQYPTIRTNERERKQGGGDKKIGRITTERIKDFLDNA